MTTEQLLRRNTPQIKDWRFLFNGVLDSSENYCIASKYKDKVKDTRFTKGSNGT